MDKAKPCCISKQEVWDAYKRVKANQGAAPPFRPLFHLPTNVNGELPLSIGGGIGQARTQMLLLRRAHLGEVSVTVWPKILKDMCAKKKIFVLE